MTQPPPPKPPTAASGRSLLLWVGVALMCLAVYLMAVVYFFFVVSAPLYAAGVVLVLASGPGRPAWLKVLAVWFPLLAGIGTAALQQWLASR